MEAVDWFEPLGFPPEKVAWSLEKVGNESNKGAPKRSGVGDS